MTDDPRLDGLLAANVAFYQAFEELDLAAMRGIWLDTPEIICIHPGWTPCRGREEIEESWRRIFENTPYIEFEIGVLDHGTAGDRGWVICEEAITQSQATGIRRSLVMTTNMFVERDGQWRMTLHHGSPVAQ